jgi:DNA-binding MarR family transcriptional regulator
VTPHEPSDDGLPQLPCVCATLRRAARAVTQLYERQLRGTGLTGPQFTLLQVLSKIGPVTQGRLGRVLALDSTTLSRTLRPLEAKRWILCDPGSDRRERRLELTPAGRSHLQKAVPAWERAQRRLRARLGGQRWQVLLTELSTLAGVAQDA